MKVVKQKVKVEITIKLNLEETIWLRGQLQDPLHGQSFEDEPIEDREMRRVFWNNLPDLREISVEG